MRIKQYLLLLFVLGVSLAACSSYAVTSVQLLANPGFEEGISPLAPPWWNQNAWGQGTTGGAVDGTPGPTGTHSGTKMWRMTGAAVGDTHGDNVEQGPTFAPIAGTFNCSAWIRVPTASASNPVRVQFRWWLGTSTNNYQFGSSNLNPSTLTTADWTQITASIVAGTPVTQSFFDVIAVSNPDTSMVAYVDDASMTADYYTLTGRVVDQDGKPAQGAVVTMQLSGTAAGTATTDSTGHYSFPVCPNQTYSLVASKVNYGSSDTLNISVGNGDATAGDLMVTALDTYLIHGKITLQGTTTGIAGVQVSAVALDDSSGTLFGPGAANTTTDANGNYSLTVLSNGYTVGVSKMGYAPPAGTKTWTAYTYDRNTGYPQDCLLNIELVNSLLVNIDASTLSGTTASDWVNSGSYGGSFKTVNGANPTVSWVNYYKAVTFAGGTGMMLKAANGTNILTDALLSGNASFTVSAWLYDPAIGGEEAYLCWAHRGGTDGTCAQFNFGNDGARGAATHVGATDLPWGAAAPTASAWHNVVVTYDGKTEKAYIDGVLANSKTSTLALFAANPVQIGGAFGSADGTTFSNGFDGSIARLRVYGSAATDADVAALYADAPASLPALSGVVSDSNGPVANAYVRFGGASGLSMTTGANGAFKFPISGAGTFELLANAPGHNASVENVTLTGTVSVTHPVTLSVTQISVPRTSDLLFGFVADDLPASGAIATWPTVYPTGGSLTAMAGTSPVAENVMGKTWEQNLYADADGLQFGGANTSSIPVNGASIVTMVKPTRNATVTSWTSVVDIFQDRLVLGVRGDQGCITVRRNGSNDLSLLGIPNGQVTVLSLVVQPDGTYKVWANGTLMMDAASNGAFTSLVPGAATAAKYINVGRSGNTSYPWTAFNGNIADTYVYKVALSDSERGQLEVGLASKYGVPAWTVPATSVANLAQLKAKAAGTLVNLTGTATVVYAPKNSGGSRTTNFFYIAETKGIAGLRIVDKTSDTLTLGNHVTNLTGYVRKPAVGEAYLELTADPSGSGSTPIPPVGANNKVAQSEPRARASAIRVWGKVSGINASTLTISDGYSSEITVNINGVNVPSGLNTTNYVAVDGVINGNGSIEAQSISTL